MSGFRLFKEKISEKLEEISNSFSKLSQNMTEFLQKVSNTGKSLTDKVTETHEKFETFLNGLQPEAPLNARIQNGLKIKKLIDGEMSFQDLDMFTKVLWENHEIANETYEQTNNIKYYEMAMDIKLVIKELEELKEYLVLHGKT
ncbi:MAG TPA: hypothetical protein VMV49_18755 [Candidatus Deferrimicrobium sp.]|nr:hypothetical protein [Candidatus Deferrimicrobium sp.]